LANYNLLRIRFLKRCETSISIRLKRNSCLDNNTFPESFNVCSKTIRKSDNSNKCRSRKVTYVGVGKLTYVGVGKFTYVGVGKLTYVGVGKFTYVGVGKFT
jgi:hypothetical protein